ncbi:hypothetical protein [Xanthomonas phage JGB6]|nr:hypothetical protein [Xanthomonas phage JGB6]
MATGDITRQVALLGELASNGSEDPKAIEKCKSDMVFAIAGSEPFASVAVLGAGIGRNIGYLAGYLPVELGNEVLRLFHVEHPVFGRTIPEGLDEVFKTGQRIGKEWAAKRQKEAEAAKKIKQASELGVALPDGDEAWITRKQPSCCTRFA